MHYCSHIALRQDHYECSLLFLMRKARLDLRNKNDQLPVDCISVKNPKCATIIKLSTTLHDLMKDTPKYPLGMYIPNYYNFQFFFREINFTSFLFFIFQTTSTVSIVSTQSMIIFLMIS